MSVGLSMELGQGRMLTHLLKAWPYGGWWMPAVSTDTSTLSGVAYCWSFQLMMATRNQAHHVPPARHIFMTATVVTTSAALTKKKHACHLFC